MFHSTVGVFDGDDRRVGYCRWAFKGSGPADEFAVLRADHSLAGEVRRAGEAEYRVSGPSGGAQAVVSVSAAGYRVSLPGAGEGPDGVLLIAAVVVLFQQVVAQTPNRSPGQPT
jgi:hypothetical protein